MASSTTLSITKYMPTSTQRQPLFTRQLSTSLPEWHFTESPHSRLSLQTTRASKEVMMVDPLEAKRLASKQMEEIKAKEKLEREREIEAVNGAWAMLGLTAGLVVEGQTGKGILDQLAGYMGSIVGLFVR